MEARRAKTRRAFGRGLVHDSRPPEGGTPCNSGLDSPPDSALIFGSITQKRVANRVYLCKYEPSQMIFARPGNAATNREAEENRPTKAVFFRPGKSGNLRLPVMA